MLISVKHTTTHRYEKEAQYSIQSLRLIPSNFDGQLIKSWKISSPNQDNALAFTDCFGNQVQTITIEGTHNTIEICAEGIVETKECNGIFSGFQEFAPVSVFLRSTNLTEADDAITDLARSVKEENQLQSLHALNATILDMVEYKKGCTNSKTTASDALSKGKGVCQDHTHIFISAARTLNIPARYITGYLVTEKKDEAHHAWAEVYVKNLGWVGFDVSNQLCPTEEYIRLACGLDSKGAAPIRGTFQGGEHEQLDVSVDVQQQQ